MNLQGIGSIVSGIGSVFGGRKESKPKFNDYKKAARGSLQGTIQQARASGLHPLAALGHSIAGPSTTVGTSAGDRIAAAGEAISQAGAGKIGKEIAQSELRRNEAEIAEIEARTETLKTSTARALQGGPGGPINYGSPEATTSNGAGPNVQTKAPMLDIEQFEKRYDEPGALIAGVANIGKDASDNLKKGMSELGNWITKGERPPGLKDLRKDIKPRVVDRGTNKMPDVKAGGKTYRWHRGLQIWKEVK